jgi:hypothetical protein
MKTKNLILLALAGAGIYFIYNKMKKKTLPTASAVRTDLTKDVKDVVKEFDAEVRER